MSVRGDRTGMTCHAPGGTACRARTAPGGSGLEVRDDPEYGGIPGPNRQLIVAGLQDTIVSTMPKPRSPTLLVVSRTADLAEAVHRATDGVATVDRAGSPDEALERVRSTRPDIVVIGDLGAPEAAPRFARVLNEGWISRHSSVIVVDDAASVDPSWLKERITRELEARENKLKVSIQAPDNFCLIWEQIPGLGAFETRQEAVLENARKAARAGKVCGISVTDNPGGNPAIATEILSREIRALGIEPLVHVAFRDRSRNQVESLLYQLAAMDINNLLVLTGDYPSGTSYTGTSRPVFDLDAVTGLQLIAEMNRGMEHEIMRKKTTLAPTDFFSGVAFSPFKRDEAEVMGQYYKLAKKIRAGAGFTITQVGYDARKWHELLLWLRTRRYRFPALASIYVLSEATARAMNANRIPGCVVTDKLMAEVAAESRAPDKGRQARLDRAAKMYAIARGIGFAGASISGQGLPYESVEYIIGKGNELVSQWPDLVSQFDYPQGAGFYLFEPDPKTGLNREVFTPRRERPSRPLIYTFSRVVHHAVFEPRGLFFPIVRALARRVDRSDTLSKIFGSLEFWNKAVLYGCLNCGDCALHDVAFLCPVSQCPKNQRNGPCGGSHNGWCEVYDKKKQCIWVRAYRRLKSHHKEDGIEANLVPPCNWELWGTSSWLNYFNGRDHLSAKTGIRPPSARQQKS